MVALIAGLCYSHAAGLLCEVPGCMYVKAAQIAAAGNEPMNACANLGKLEVLTRASTDWGLLQRMCDAPTATIRGFCRVVTLKSSRQVRQGDQPRY